MARKPDVSKAGKSEDEASAGAQASATGAPTGTAQAEDTSVRGRIIAAVLALAAEERWEEFSIADVVRRAGVTLAEFRENFPSKGAVLAAFSRKVDQIVLQGTGTDLVDESAKDRLFDVLMRRLDVLMSHREALQGIMEWARRDPAAAAGLNQVTINSMRFMLEAAGIDSEGPVGALKLQGLAFAWARVLNVWFNDDDPGLSRTMAALDKELTRGGKMVARLEDFHRLTAPLRSLACALFERRRFTSSRTRERYRRRDEDRDDRPAVV
jgi:AcrR family transcriptional regulator